MAVGVNSAVRLRSPFRYAAASATSNEPRGQVVPATAQSLRNSMSTRLRQKLSCASLGLSTATVLSPCNSHKLLL